MDTSATSIDALLRQAAAAIGESDAHSQARLLLCKVLECTPAHLISHAEDPVPPQQRTVFDGYVSRRSAGEPLAYILGECGFWTLSLAVSPAVLVPRPDTERLVEVVLELFAPEESIAVADLGTGSGAIALALASERPEWRIVGTDISREALALAAHNATRVGAAVRWICGDWCEALANSSCDLIVANPPYIDPNDIHLAQLQHEPQQALVAANNGLADLQKITAQAARCLRPGGALVLEHGFTQGTAVRNLLQTNGWCNVNTWSDLGGRERVSAGWLPPAAVKPR